jgi:hypothetical protein
MDHINLTVLLVFLAVGFFIRAVALFAFLLMMIKIQKFDFAWLPLIGSTLLASALDLIPIVGHFIAVPVLYICIWKSVRCDNFKDATFTVLLSYAFVRCLTLILLAYAPASIIPRVPHNNFASDPTVQFAVVQPTHDVAPQAEPAANPPSEPGVATQTAAATPDNSTVPTPAISIKGVIRSTTGAMVTIQCGKKDYMLSQDEGVTVSTDQGMVPVHFVEASGNEVTLSVDGQQVKYALK